MSDDEREADRNFQFQLDLESIYFAGNEVRDFYGGLQFPMKLTDFVGQENTKKNKRKISNRVISARYKYHNDIQKRLDESELYLQEQILQTDRNRKERIAREQRAALAIKLKKDRLFQLAAANYVRELTDAQKRDAEFQKIADTYSEEYNTANYLKALEDFNPLSVNK
jgi:hypothetical protein